MKIKSKKFLIGAGIVAVIAIMVVANLLRREQSAFKVEALKVEERELRAVVTASGKIRPKTSVDVSASTSGKVVRMDVDEGDRVKKGQFLLQIDPAPAEASVRQFQASIAAAEAQLELANANLQQAKLELDRQEKLYEKNLTSEDQLQKARTSYEVQQAQVKANQQDISRYQAMLASARHELSKVNISSDIAGIVTKRNIEEGENVFVGAFNNPATVLLTIADLSVIEADVDVDETDIVDVQKGQDAVIHLDAFPDRDFKGVVTKVGHSPVLSVSGVEQQQATSFEVIVQLTDTIPDVRPGLSCKADITTGYRSKATAVPIQALTLRKPSDLEPRSERMNRRNREQTDDVAADDTTVAATDTTKEEEVQGAFVITDGEVQFHEVKTGISGDRYFEVLSGLKPDDEVVTGPFRTLRRLHNGDRVKIEKRPTQTES